ncbi:SOS response-associated peptidase family protein [Aeromonas sp. FDAARGOS 1405]|uniref:SOS response-associated peptidase family protein n=1 Tax=unclassified Aeromonas TaxID=257493 RepID=UPI001C22F12A|nr:SOS response-associated peptidase family protein [Aeromonas sp. FDAARGOS 1405]QXB31371.1 SOS response-associated peptidase family protein [Aeromonas sp. FDAARGOS 1405]
MEYFGVDDPGYDWKGEVWQDYQAPILIQRDGRRQAQPGSKHYPTMNARAERWRISMADGMPFAVAGIWRAWQEEQGYTFSFSQLTINADTHPLLRRMHKPVDEKRSLVIVSLDDYDTWLGCKDPELARTYQVQPLIEQLTGGPKPLVFQG